MGKIDGALDLLRFLRYRKRYWLVPFLLVLVVFGLILVAAESSVVGPFIYTLF
ncbi:MAG TPA: DUF5989 family protein [Polyangiaceae bacterium]|nr:DUF5989 family protein [Polyangiaceae bacterium]